MAINVTSGRRCSHSPLGSRLATLLVGSISIIFSLLRFSVTPFPQKTYLAKVVRSAQKPKGTHLSRPCRPFLILQSVWRCSQRGVAVGAALQAASESFGIARLVLLLNLTLSMTDFPFSMQIGLIR